MCSIFGLVTRRNEKDDLIEKLNNSMKHRGPDMQRTERLHFDGKNAYIGHCRLSILDLSENGKQPMWSADKKYAIVFNGEIYNFKHIKKELESEGFKFFTSTDTEVLLNSYIRWGEKCVEHINGMFAFAVFDIENSQIFLARDRFGKKPLYYYNKNGVFMFASELKPFLLYNGIEKKINIEAMSFYTKNGYFPAPYSVIKDIYKFPQGSFAFVKADELIINKYWDINKLALEGLENPINNYSQGLELLEDVLTQAVEERLVADVPIGVFLSSGIDSTLITALAQKASAKQIKTYTIGVNDKASNEADVAKKTAEILGTDHHELYVNDSDMFDMIDSIPHYFDEPFADTSLVPNMVLSKTVRQDITVAVGGDGGDELFCGYPHYNLVKKAQSLDPIGGIVNSIVPESLINKLPHSIRRVSENRNPDTKCQMLLTSELKIARDMLLNESIEPYYSVETKMHIKDWQFRRMVLDMQTVLTDDMLTKVDRASMSASLEIRSPLLDYRIAELSFRFPQSFKYRNGITKYILRDIVYKYVPKEIIDVPKRGFNIPLEAWIQNNHRDLFEMYCRRDYLESQGVFDYDRVRQIVDRFFDGEKKLFRYCWYFFIFQLWYEEYGKYISN